MDMNFVFIVGRVANTPELKNFKKRDESTGNRTYFPVAVTRMGDRGSKRDDRRTSFLDCVAWGDAAKNHATHLTKGTEVAIMGELISENITNAEGEFVKKSTYILVRDVQYGRRPGAKNAAPKTDDTARITALEAEIRAIAAGRAQQPVAPIAPAVETVAGDDPFEG